MRKRSRYRPRQQLDCPLSYVINGFLPLKSAESEVMRLRIMNHGALASMAKGAGTKADAMALHHAMTTAASLAEIGTGLEYLKSIEQAELAVHSAILRGEGRLRYLFTGPELTAVNVAMEIHDAQMDACTIEHFEKAIKRAAKAAAERQTCSA